MSNRYQFTSPGAEAGKALEELMLQRELQRRQAFLDDLNKRTVESQIADREAARAAQAAQLESLSEVRANQRADRVAGNLLPGQDISNEDAAALTAGGLGSLVRAPKMVESIPQMSVSDVAAGRLLSTRFTGTYGQNAALDKAERDLAEHEADRTFRAEQADLARRDKAEQAQRDRDLRRDVANMGAQAAAGSRALMDEIRRDKLETTQSERDKATKQAQAARTEVGDLARELYNDPSLSAAVGPVSSMMPTVRGTTRDFENRVARLKGMLSLQNRQLLKGSGAISDFEAKTLEAAATALDSATDEASFKRELRRVAKTMGTEIPEPGGSGNGPAVGTLRTINGQLASWDGRGWKAVK